MVAQPKMCDSFAPSLPKGVEGLLFQAGYQPARRFPIQSSGQRHSGGSGMTAMVAWPSFFTSAF